MAMKLIVSSKLCEWLEWQRWMFVIKSQSHCSVTVYLRSLGNHTANVRDLPSNFTFMTLICFQYLRCPKTTLNWFDSRVSLPRPLCTQFASFTHALMAICEDLKGKGGFSLAGSSILHGTFGSIWKCSVASLLDAGYKDTTMYCGPRHIQTPFNCYDW